MNRRLLLLSPLAMLANSPAPADPDKLNRFIKAWNAYTQALVNGHRSIQLWAAVEKAFYKLSS